LPSASAIVQRVTSRTTKIILTKVENVVHDLPLLLSRLPLGQPELGSTSTVPGLRLGLGLDGVVGNVRVVGDVGVGGMSRVAGVGRVGVGSHGSDGGSGSSKSECTGDSSRQSACQGE
jgi:hypothetical protein